MNTSVERTRVGKYEMGKTLGEGTFAKVKVARHIETGMSVAIKILDKEKILKHKMVEQIKREISTMKLVKHPYVVQLLEVGSPFIAPFSCVNHCSVLLLRTTALFLVLRIIAPFLHFCVKPLLYCSIAPYLGLCHCCILVFYQCSILVAIIAPYLVSIICVWTLK